MMQVIVINLLLDNSRVDASLPGWFVVAHSAAIIPIASRRLIFPEDSLTEFISINVPVVKQQYFV
jgi:hypothetical protein